MFTNLLFEPIHFSSSILDKTMLSNNIMDYYVVSQGKTSIPGVDDGEEMELTDVRHPGISTVFQTTAYKSCLFNTANTLISNDMKS